MFTSILLAGLSAAAFNPPAPGADLAAINRVILKEPAYQGKPKYCLLVFGPKADTRVWMVYDGKNFFVDRNGNGDLSEPEERVPTSHGHTFNSLKVVERDGKTQHTLGVYCHGDGTFHLHVNHGNRAQYVGIELMDRPTWGDRPESAPIIHLNGPMSFERYGPLYSMPRGAGNQRRFSLRLMLGTPGVGKGTFASYDEICTENLGPIQADIVYSHKDRIGEMFEQRITLLHDG